MRGCSSLVSCCHNIGAFLKMIIMIGHIKMMQIPYLEKYMLLSRQVPHRSNSNHLFWTLEDSVLVQTLSYRRQITYHLLPLCFIHK